MMKSINKIDRIPSIPEFLIPEFLNFWIPGILKLNRIKSSFPD
jgi:hypothetical protein